MRMDCEKAGFGVMPCLECRTPPSAVVTGSCRYSGRSAEGEEAVTTIDPEAPASAYRTRGWWRDETVLDDLRRAVARHPGKTAIVCHHTDGRPVERLTFAELAAYVDRFAAALAALGVRPGDVV